MDWFLYDNGVRHERVKAFNFVRITSNKLRELRSVM